MGTLLQNRRRAITALLGLGAAFWLLGAGAAHSESYHYDAAGRLTQAAYSDGTTVGFVYDTRGNLLTRLASAAGTDSDGDGLPDSVETGSGVFVDTSDTGTNPASADSDGDTVDDGAEVAAGTNPNDPSDFPSPSVPALTPPGVGLLAFLLAAAALQWIRVRRRRSLVGQSGPGRGWMAVWLVPALLVASAGEVRAHYCGDKGHGSFAELDLQVGQSFNYVIRADVAESEETQYSVASLSPPGIVTVSPAAQATLQRAVFQILAVAPGQTFVGLSWLYPPNFDPETGEGQGMCFLQVNVSDDPADADPPTGATQADSGMVGDPVNSYTGELVLPWQLDLDLGGPLPLQFSRYYASDLAQDGEVIGALGAGWVHNFELRSYSQGDERRIVYFGGAVLRFSAEGGGSFTLIEPLEVSYQLVSDGSDLLLGDPNRELIYRFDDSGRLTAIADRSGNTHTLSYDQFNLTQVADGLGRVLSFSYADGNALSTVSDGTRSWSFAVSTFSGVLSSATDPLGNTTQYSYSNDLFSPIPSQLLQVTRPEGNSPYQQAYDSERRVATQTSANGDTTSLAYAKPSTTITNPLGGTVIDTHDADGNLTSQVDEAGNTSQLVYDAQGQRQSLTDREGNTTAYTYHAASGKVASITRADTTVTSFTYAESAHASGLSFFDLVRIDHPDGTFETLVRDAAGNATSHTTRGGEVSSFTYNARGQILTATNAAGGVSTLTYNPGFSLASVATPAGDTTNITYDALSRPTTVTLPDGNTTTAAYDAGNLITATTDPAGQTASTTYDDNGRATGLTDRLGNTSTRVWDAMDQPTSASNPLGNTTTVAYDALDRVASISNAAGETTAFTRDAVGRVTAVTDPGGQAWARSYDAEGLVATLTDPLGATATLSRDALGRVTGMTSPLGFDTSIAYDSMGRATGRTDALGRTTTRSYDANGRIAGVSLPGGIATTAYTRNALGRITQLTDPGGNAWANAFDNQGRGMNSTDPLGRETSVAYDTRSRVNAITFPDGLGSVANSFDANGNLTQALYSDTTNLAFGYDALNRLTSADGVTRSFDAAGRMTEGNGLTFTHDAVGRLLTVTYAPGKTVTYAYDSRGLLASVTDWEGQAVTLSWHPDGNPDTLTRSNGVHTTWSHDADSRVTNIAHGALAGVALAYDAAGQLTGATRSGPQSAAAPGAGTTTQGFDAASQLAGASHDALGRQTQDGGRGYAWDLASRLTSITQGTTTTGFEYDGLGRRTARSDGGTTRSFVWNDALGLPSVAVEREGGADLRFYIHTPGGALLYSVAAADDSRRFYHFDETGNTVLLTDGAGTVVASYAYGPYGEVVAATPAVDNPYTWQGRLGVAQEGDGGLYYARARYYDSARARFLSTDPIESLGPRGHNPYQYAYANPLGFGDPTGLLPDGPSILREDDHPGASDLWRLLSYRPREILKPGPLFQLPGMTKDQMKAKCPIPDDLKVNELSDAQADAVRDHSGAQASSKSVTITRAELEQMEGLFGTNGANPCIGLLIVNADGTVTSSHIGGNDSTTGTLKMLGPYKEGTIVYFHGGDDSSGGVMAETSMHQLKQVHDYFSGNPDVTLHYFSEDTAYLDKNAELWVPAPGTSVENPRQR